MFIGKKISLEKLRREMKSLTDEQRGKFYEWFLWDFSPAQLTYNDAQLMLDKLETIKAEAVKHK